MYVRKFINIVVLMMVAVSLMFGGAGQASAQKGQPPQGGNGQTKDKKPKITQADREAAAARAAEKGLQLPAAGMADMSMPGEAPHYFSVPNYANSPLPGNVVAEWNAIAQDILQPAPMPGMPMMTSEISMSAAFVYLSYMQAAVYDALVAIEGGFSPYAYTGPVNPAASREAAVAAAAYKILEHYLPAKAPAAIYQNALEAIPNGPAKDAGIAIGQAAADGIIALRANDGLLDLTETYTVLPPGPGVWEPSRMPDGTVIPPVDPWMATLKPFLRDLPEQYRPAPPPALDDPAYLADLAEVRDWGGAMSSLRTPAQTETANFWATNMVIQTNQAYRQVSESRGLGLLDTARLMAMGNMAAADSLIATFDSKYTYSFWRPVTAIQHTNPDGTYSAAPLNSWMPAVMTPSFPEYVAGHGSFVSAQAEVFTQFFGTPQIEIDLSSLATGTTRHYAAAADLRSEIIDARTWAGLHFRSSSVLAVQMGQQLVLDGLAAHFIPDPLTDTGQHAAVSGGIRKFVDGLPGLGAANANNLGQYISVAVPDTTTYPGSDYYEIAVVEYQEQMHSDLPPTKLRGYVQLETAVVQGSHYDLGGGRFAVEPPHYLGATIVAQKNRPVRVKFYNLLPTGQAGNLFIPVDTTVMGSGGGPLMNMNEPDPQNPMCGMTPKPYECYTENRATLHLHGGISPWISDGTPHQWITPAGENTPYPQGVSVVPVPDMSDSGNPNDGVMTFYYTNQQSARLMFYHDHSWGITRLNVYAGEAAGYLLTDSTEQSLVGQGIVPADQIPLVIQDKTFVPPMTQLAMQDPTWDMSRWGGPGDLWLPHVYSPAQNPGDASGVNQFGRWAYGPWFWPPTSAVENGPISNPYYDPACDPDVQWCEPPTMPGVPFNSMGMEAFMDTPVVNGTAYPTLTVDPKPYRFRVLNAANDRFFNLSLYKAVDANGALCDINNPNPAPESTGATCTEVLLNPAEVAAALADPAGIFPTPMAGTEGPSWIQIGTEGGFLPAPVVIAPQVTTWVTDPTVFNAGNVDKHGLLIAPAERADVIVDFSQYAGQTLILYNDAPAAFPARDPRYDYYTGNPDLRDTGGTPPTLPGYGPNTRTVMQIKVNGGPGTSFNLNALQTAFKATSLGGQGVFQNGQHPIIVGQGAYNSAYGTTFQSSGPQAGLVQIFDTSLTFKTLLGSTLTIPLKPKMIQDEMGEAFEHEYGRMSGFLGVETANAQAGLQNMILYPYASPPTEIIDGVEVGGTDFSLDVTPIASASDGTQIWKITHNGVDTHPIHWHLYEVQVLNRVGWDGIIRKPDANELGWKDTLRVSPLEDTIVALRPIIPHVPFDLPNSVRLIDPSMPEGAYIANTTAQEAAGLPIFAFNPDGEPIDVINHYVNYGWEYVLHCHILSHEEMDMMRAQVVGIAPKAPTFVSAVRSGSGTRRQYLVTWIDNSKNETAFVIERRVAGTTTAWTKIATVPSTSVTAPGTGTRTYANVIGNTNTLYEYQVYAINVVGDTWDYSDPALNEIPPGGGFPTLTLDSRGGSISSLTAPTGLAAAFTAKSKKTATVNLTWSDTNTSETGSLIQRADNAAFSLGVVNATVGPNITTFSQSVTPGKTYYYRVLAFSDTLQSAWSNTASVTIP